VIKLAVTPAHGFQRMQKKEKDLGGIFNSEGCGFVAERTEIFSRMR
jgi:hypothetical protein